jgi:hypothetical protein
MKMAAIESGAGAIGIFGKVAVIAGAGLLGAAAMAAFDPPTTKKQLFVQAAIALGCSFMFGPTAVKAADFYFDFINLAGVSNWIEFMETAAPIYALVGALSWGFVGLVASLRKLIRNKGANSLFDLVTEPSANNRRSRNEYDV